MTSYPKASCLMYIVDSLTQSLIKAFPKMYFLHKAQHHLLVLGNNKHLSTMLEVHFKQKNHKQKTQDTKKCETI